MTIRKLLLILFLYVLLVWIIAGYLHLDDVKALTDLGLLWTGIGVAALLCGVLLERVFGWWRSRRMQKTARPAKAAAGPRVLNEDDTTLISLIEEANLRLAQAPGNAGVRPAGVLDLPVLLALGPERAGKTAVIHHSGLEPSLLAGQAVGDAGAVVSTRVANLWLSHNSLLLEVSGRIFGSERLGEFLSNLQPSGQTGWRSWLMPRRRPTLLRGILLFFDAREFMGTPEPSKLDRWAQAIRARLLAAASVFGAECPVYVLFTNTDALPYFEDFFNGLAEAEAGQVLGVITERNDAETQGRVWAESETKRLNQLFQSLFLRLGDRRLIALSQETDPTRKPSIYEFPREFRRIRAPLVQFLVDVFKPDPLSPGPRMRGIFFTGTRKVEETSAPAGVSQVYQPRAAAPDATQIFAPGGMTQVFRPRSKSGSGRLADRWVFTADFFQKVLSLDRPLVRSIPTRLKFDKHREIVVGVAAGLAVLLGLIWTISWIGNWDMVSRVETVVRDVQTGNADLNMTNLQALDRLREQLVQLQQENPLHLHWGFFTGDDLREAATKAYFARLKQLSLDRINQTLAVRLRQAGSAEQQGDSSGTYDQLKTHRTIAARACPVDQPLVRKVLMNTVAEAHSGLGEAQRSLLDTQLNFYVTQLAANKNLPLRLTEDGIGVENARAFVRQQNGLDQRLRDLLSEISGQVKPLAVLPEYRAVLNGPTEFPGIFTRQGELIFEDRVARDNFGSEERCVMGDSAGQQTLQRLDTGTRDRLRSLYYREYADAWRDFLSTYKVISYASLDDAVQKLTSLSDSRSPLLGIVRMAAENTNFQPPKPGELTWWEKAAQKVGFGGALQAESAGEKSVSRVGQLLSSDAPLMTAADVATLFQPVLITTPPADLLVNANNKDYVEGLRKLTQGLDGLSRASTAERAGALAAANAALTQASAAHTALSDKFPDVGKEGLNKMLADLLNQPIKFASALIPANMEISSGAKKNGDLKQACREMAPILARYPFNPNAPPEADATQNDVERAFGPIKGIVWQYVQKSGSDLVVLKEQGWEQKPDLQGLKVAPELLTFLNRAQDLKKTFFTESGIQRIRYVLRRVPNQTIGVQLVLDGQELAPQESLQKTFYWPTAPGVPSGAAGNVIGKDSSFGFGSFNDLWAVFRLFQNADERPLLKREVQWSQIRGRGGAAFQPINPPARIEVVEFPGGVDLFNPKFFDDLRCPGRAALVN